MSAGSKSADEAASDALFEKLRAYAAKPQEAGDALRTTAAKIHARITSSGRQNSPSGLSSLFRVARDLRYYHAFFISNKLCDRPTLGDLIYEFYFADPENRYNYGMFCDDGRIYGTLVLTTREYMDFLLFFTRITV